MNACTLRYGIKFFYFIHQLLVLYFLKKKNTSTMQILKKSSTISTTPLNTAVALYHLITPSSPLRFTHTVQLQSPPFFFCFLSPPLFFAFYHHYNFINNHYNTLFTASTPRPPQPHHHLFLPFDLNCFNLDGGKISPRLSSSLHGGIHFFMILLFCLFIVFRSQ